MPKLVYNEGSPMMVKLAFLALAACCLEQRCQGEDWKASLKPFGVLITKGYHINSLAFSPDRKYLLTGSSDGLVSFWNLKTGKIEGKPLPEAFPRRGPIRQRVLSSDGKYLAGLIDSGRNSLAYIWNVKDKKLHRIIDELPFASSLAFSPDGKKLAVTALNFVQMINVATGQKVWSSHVDPGFRSAIAFSPDGRILAFGGYGFDRFRVFDAVNGKEKTPAVKMTGGAFSCLTFSRDGKYLIVTGLKCPVHVFAVRKNNKLRLFQQPTRGWTNSLGVSRHGRLLVTIDDRGRIVLWDFRKGTRLFQMAGTARGSPLAFSHDGNSFAVIDQNGNVRRWDIAGLIEKLKGRN